MFEVSLAFPGILSLCVLEYETSFPLTYIAHHYYYIIVVLLLLFADGSIEI